MSETKPMTTSLRLPSAAIRRIVKLNTEVSGMNAEGVVLLSKLTEEFIELMVAISAQEAQLQKRKIIKVQDVSAAARKRKLDFLDSAFG